MPGNSSHLCCPCRTKSEVELHANGKINCMASSCPYSEARSFRRVGNIPVLIPFGIEDTICDEATYEVAASDEPTAETPNTYYVERKRRPLRNILKRYFLFNPDTNRAEMDHFLDCVRTGNEVLVIGAGTRGDGTGRLWDGGEFSVTGIDIYPSSTVDYIADAHFLPFKDASFDGVLIQAVLEHVLEPAAVADEIYRVLKDGGIVYAETPFMQQVHEGAYDFQRFTVTGHRWLFRRFEQINIGPLKGPGITLAWSLKYFFWALTRNRRIGSLAFIPAFFVLQLFDRLISSKYKWDGASGCFFLGRKTPGFKIRAKEIVNQYGGAQ